MLVNLAMQALGVLVFLFLFWRRLKEDYASEIVFKTASAILLGFIIGWVLSVNFFGPWYLFAEFFGAITGLGFSALRYRIRFYESLEASLLSFLPWLSFMFLGDSIANASLSSFLGFLVILVIIFFNYYMDIHYREFTWYRSGKVGFVGLASLGLVFLTRSLVAILGVSVLSFVGKYEATISGSLAFICFLLLFNLGRKS